MKIIQLWSLDGWYGAKIAWQLGNNSPARLNICSAEKVTFGRWGCWGYHFNSQIHDNCLRCSSRLPQSDCLSHNSNERALHEKLNGDLCQKTDHTTILIKVSFYFFFQKGAVRSVSVSGAGPQGFLLRGQTGPFLGSVFYVFLIGFIGWWKSWWIRHEAPWYNMVQYGNLRAQSLNADIIKLHEWMRNGRSNMKQATCYQSVYQNFWGQGLTGLGLRLEVPGCSISEYLNCWDIASSFGCFGMVNSVLYI